MTTDHLQFAQHYLIHRCGIDAYLHVRPYANRKSASTTASKWIRRPDVAAFIAQAEEEAQRRALEESILSVMEKRQFLARIVRTPITALDPHDPANPANVLIKSFAINESEAGSSTRLEKLDPLRAIQIDNDLAGEGTAANTLRELHDALQSLASSSTLPTGQL